VNREALARVAALIAKRNAVDAEIGAITGRPVVAGHLGEWIAAQVFDIELEPSAVAKGIDGRFNSGPLAGRSVNVKWYGKREGNLDLAEDSDADLYLVMTGPRAAPVSSLGGTRPLRITAVYLFAIPELLDALRARGVKIGIAASVRVGDWDAAEIFPRHVNAALVLSHEQRTALELFGGESGVRRGTPVRSVAAAAAGQPNTPPKAAHVGGDCVVFRGNDDGYLEWLAAHPTGYVVNAERNPRPSYLKLHRATCRYISGPPRTAGAWTERQYIKVCATDVVALERWASEAVGGRVDTGCACT
jgi:hypothetical protein